VIRAQDLGVIECHTCELVMRAAAADVVGQCPRCGETVRRRKVDGRTRSWALLIAAAALYVPANTLTMMHTAQFPMTRSNTVLSGVEFLWNRGSWDLAAIVFIASIVVPVVKMLTLAVLLVIAHRGTSRHARAHTTVYRVLEAVGHWSMLDVFVVALLTAVVQLGRFATVAPGPAVLPFAGVVVLTMLASASFDPRTIWDRVTP
jgi:paraquat-inducible protein A